MEPRKAQVKTPKQPKDGRNARFQIVKLEERIAPSHRGHCKGGAYNGRNGTCKH